MREGDRTFVCWLGALIDESQSSFQEGLELHHSGDLGLIIIIDSHVDLCLQGRGGTACNINKLAPSLFLT